MAPAISSISQDHQHSNQFSGIILSQNALATGSINWRAAPYNSQTIYQNFYLPTDIQAGTLANELRVPDLSGFQVLVTVDSGFSQSASLAYTLDYYVTGAGWVSLTSGTAIGCHTDGQGWFDIIFNKPVPVTTAMRTAQLRIGVTTQSTTLDVIQEPVTNNGNGTYVVETQLVTASLQNGVPYPVTVNGRAGFLLNDNGSVTFSVQQGVGGLSYVQPSLAIGTATLADGTPLLGGSTLNFRLLALVADSGTDFLGNEYRSRVTRVSGDNNGPWQSPALPSPFAVVSRYWDLRPASDILSLGNLNLVVNPNYEYDPLGATSVFAWMPFDNLVNRVTYKILNNWFAKGTQSLRSTSTFSSSAGAYSGVAYPGGSTVLSIKGRAPVNIQCAINLLSLPTSGSLVMTVLWYDGSNNLISSSLSNSTSSLGVQTLSLSTIAPPTTKSATLMVSCSSTASGTLDFYIDTVQVSPSPGPYLDGDIPGYVWLGQRGHSYSASNPSTQTGNSVVVDGVFVDPATPNMAFNVYYSTDDSTTSTNMSSADWEQKLWTRVPKTYTATQSQNYIFPQPVRAKYMKLEFTNLLAQKFTPGKFTKPVRYKKFPTWVADYFIAQLEQVSFVSNLVNVQNDALTLAYDYYLDDLHQNPDTPIGDPTTTLSTLTDYFNPNNFANQVDIDTLRSINLTLSQFKLPTGSIVDTRTLLGSNALALTSNPQNTSSLTAERPAPQPTSNSTVSTLQREDVILEQSIKPMYFFLTCRHTYKELLASFDYNKAYFAGTNSVSFIRSNYTASVDAPLYVESGGDLKNADINDFKIDTDGNWYTYVE